jgi:predicted enzyme related to lactoylglutathione lyase
MNYGMVDNAGQGIGGGISGGDGQTTAVTFYVEVDDPQAYLDKIESEGGKTIMPVTEVPGMVIFAQFADPEGNVVGITKAGYPG